MAQIGKVNAVFTSSTGGLTSGVSRASASMRRMEASVGSLGGSMRALVAIQGAQLFGSIAASASNAVGSLVRMGQAEADVIDNTSKLAARLGMTYGELSGLALAGDLAGVSMETIGAAATKADVAFVKAANGSATAVAAFNAIGLSVDQLNGLSASERFDAIADSISQLPTEAERAAAAVALFGRSGAQLLPLFAGGAEGIAAARAEADRFGLSLSNVQGRNVEEMNDSFTRAQKAVQGVVQQVVAYLAPAVTSITTAFSDFVGTVGGANIGQSIGEGILAGARYLATVSDYFIGDGTKLWEFATSIGAQWNAVWAFGAQVSQFFVGVANTLEAAFKLVGSILTGVAGRFLNAAGELAQMIPGFGDSGRVLEAAGESLMRSSTAMWEEAGQAGLDAGNNFAQAFGLTEMEAAGNAVAGPLTRMFDDALAQSREAAASIDEAGRNPIEIKQVINATAVKDAVSGIDSRSAEGIKEMFRLMRGNQDRATQERIAAGIEQIADNTADIGGSMDIESIDLAPAAGG